MLTFNESFQQTLIYLVAGIACFGAFLFFLIPPSLSTANRTDFIEGMTNGGEGGSAASFAAGLKAKTVDLQDTMLIGKYRADYEAVLMNLDDYLGTLMLKRALSLNPDAEGAGAGAGAGANGLRELAELSAARVTLNETMHYLDGLQTATV